MTVEEQVLQKLRELPTHKQAEVLAFVNRLREGKTGGEQGTVGGLWADLNVHITEEDIADGRREMWGSFPRDLT